MTEVAPERAAIAHSLLTRHASPEWVRLRGRWSTRRTELWYREGIGPEPCRGERIRRAGHY
jgi:hypothetical protein